MKKIVLIILLLIIIMYFILISKIFINGYSFKASNIILFNNYSKEYNEILNNYFTNNYDKNKYKSIRNSKYYNKNNLAYYLDIKNDKINQEMMKINMKLNYSFYTNIEEIKNPYDLDILVNKYYKLPKNFNPDITIINHKNSNNKSIRKEISEFVIKLLDDALKNNINLYIVSAYRTNDYQNILYTSYIKNNGKEYADSYSARPYHSEHETGLAIDVSTDSLSLDDFYNTKGYTFMIENAYKYGFILRYPKDKEHITGYNFEPWHFRYVGKEIAYLIHKENITLEEYKARNDI